MDSELVLAVKEFAVYLWAQPETKIIVGSVFLNLVVAIAASIYLGTFRLYKTAEFLYRKLLPYTLIYGAARLVANWIDASWLATTAFAALQAGLLSDLLENLASIGIKRSDREPNGWIKTLVTVVTKEE